MTEDEKWRALELTDLSEHDPFCNYGKTNGREMCTCQILVDLVERVENEGRSKGSAEVRGGVAGADTAATGADRPRPAGTRSEQRARRLAQQRRDAAHKAGPAARAAKKGLGPR